MSLTTIVPNLLNLFFGESLGYLDHLCLGDVTILISVVKLECRLSHFMTGFLL